MASDAKYQETYELRRTTLAEMKTKWKQSTLHSNMATQQDTKSSWVYYTWATADRIYSTSLSNTIALKL